MKKMKSKQVCMLKKPMKTQERPRAYFQWSPIG